MIKKMPLCVMYIILLCVTLFTAACGKESVDIVAPKQVETVESAEVGQIPVDVYMDATTSMMGFATLANGNIYRTLPDLLTDIGDQMGGVSFYKFGENVTKLEGREHRAFSSTAPYTELITAAHNVIDNANEEHLSVIITDLFESDSDWSLVTKKLKDKYFAKHEAVAIIGVKNPFYGKIYDVGLNAKHYDYNSGDDPARFRPFYLIVMGKEQKVREFMEIFKEKVNTGNEVGFLLLSERLADNTKPFSKLEINEGMQNLYENGELELKDKSMREFGVTDENETATLIVPFNYKPMLGQTPIDKNKLNVKIQGFLLSAEKAEDGSNVWEDLENVDKIKTELIENNNEYQLKIDFIPTEVLGRGKINLLNVKVTPDAKAYVVPDWVNAWNMANVDIDPNNFDGAKTVHLNHIIESLKNSALSAATPQLINVNLVFDER